MPASGGLHYPHSTIESAGHSLSGHADTLHNTASSASGISLPSGSLGSIASGHAGTLQTHISGVSGHISTIAEREGNHGDTLVRNSTTMRNTDSDHANAFNRIGNQGPPRITYGPGGVIDGRTPVGEHSGIDQLTAGTGGPTRTPGLAAAKAAGHTGVDTSYPAAPHQPAPGATGVPLESHQHMGGEMKPGKGKKPKPSVVGGHVAASDYDPHYADPDPSNPWKRPIGPPSGNVHGHGVVVPPGGAGAAPGSNGVYNVNHVPFADGSGGTLSHPVTGAPLNKPISTMFPQGVPSGQVWNMGEQAWNGGNPSGGMNRPNAGGAGNSTWYGHAQVPFTPAWNPGNDPSLPPHGSGDGNSPHAGDVVNIQGFHRPMDPTNPGVQHPATYFPQPPANQPPVPPPDPNWADTSPKRTYDDPNYPE